MILKKKKCTESTRNILFGLLISFLTATANFVLADDNGGYAGAYTRFGLGARAMAMGNTGVASDPTSYSAYYNPASAAMVENRMAGLSYSFMSLDRRLGYISFSMEVPPAAGFSLGWIESGFGDLYSYNSIGQQTGELNHSANVVFFAFGRRFTDRLAVGVAIKILFESINDGTDQFDYSSNGVGIDIGLRYEMNDRLTIGYQIRDINSKLEANTDNIFEQGGTTIDRFPIINKVGAHYITPWSWLRAAYEFEWSNQRAYKHHIGFEALYGENLALRAGWNDSQLTFGAGFDFEILKLLSYLDYAFIGSVVDEGGSHVFTWQVSF